MKQFMTITTFLIIGFTFLLNPTKGFSSEQDLSYGLKCPSLKINFLGPRYGDLIEFDPTKKFFQDILSHSELKKNLFGLHFSFFTGFGSCERGVGNVLVECTEDKSHGSMRFSYSELVGSSSISQTVTIARGLKISDISLKVVTKPGLDVVSNKEITIVKLVFDALVESSEGLKEIHYEQRVGEWLNPIPSDRSDYGLCVIR